MYVYHVNFVTLNTTNLQQNWLDQEYREAE